MNINLRLLLVLLIFVLSSCNNPYKNPAQQNLKVYDEVRRELFLNQQKVFQSFRLDNPEVKVLNISLADFEHNTALANTYPKPYHLLQRNEAADITLFSNKCLFVTLNRYRNIIKDKVEYLKYSGLDDCSFERITASTVLKSVKLGDDWTYEISEIYFD